MENQELQEKKEKLEGLLTIKQGFRDATKKMLDNVKNDDDGFSKMVAGIRIKEQENYELEIEAIENLIDDINDSLTEDSNEIL